VRAFSLLTGVPVLIAAICAPAGPARFAVDQLFERRVGE
jgi:hypothetical protein